jgi:hypothetical protein
MNKEINRHLRALTYDNTSLENYPQSLPFVQRITNSNYSDRLKISASQLLFGNVLNLDLMEFFVESILDHRGTESRSTSEFLVKWQDYPNSANSWEPYSSLRDVVVLHDYLKLKKLHRLLNKQHR